MKKIILFIATAQFLAGCASNFPPTNPSLKLQSKVLKAPDDMALVYIVRPWQFFGADRSPEITFSNVALGDLSVNEYIYFLAYPTESMWPRNHLNMWTLKPRDLGVMQLDLQAGNIYFLEFNLMEGYSYKQISEEDGRKFLMTHSLSNHFRPMIIGKPKKPNEVANIAPNANNALVYDDQTKIGRIKYITEINNRDRVFTNIGEICNAKNVAIQSGNKLNTGSASYRTLDEKYDSGEYEITFQCLY